MNIKLLRAKMVMAGDNQNRLREALGLSGNAMSFKMNGKAQFKAEEIAKIVWRYNLTPQETHDIFFGSEVKHIEESDRG